MGLLRSFQANRTWLADVTTIQGEAQNSIQNYFHHIIDFGVTLFTLFTVLGFVRETVSLRAALSALILWRMAREVSAVSFVLYDILTRGSSEW
jgi:hypothetical protein